MSGWIQTDHPHDNSLSNQDADAILYRQFGRRWRVMAGSLDAEYTEADYRRHGLDFESLDEAIAHALALAELQGFSELEVFQDYGI